MKTETELDLLAMLLRDKPLCTSAEISDFAIAFWDGRRLAWARLRNNGSGHVDAIFNLDLDAWDELCGYVDDWLASPRYSDRPELRRWLQNAQQQGGRIHESEATPIKRHRYEEGDSDLTGRGIGQHCECGTARQPPVGAVLRLYEEGGIV